MFSTQCQNTGRTLRGQKVANMKKARQVLAVKSWMKLEEQPPSADIHTNPSKTYFQCRESALSANAAGIFGVTCLHNAWTHQQSYVNVGRLGS